MTTTHFPAYEPLDTILVRTPLLPSEAYAGAMPPMARAEWIAPAIAVGSLTLARAQADEKSAAARLRYHIRMTTRPTPYGLFAGVSLASWGERTTLRLTDAPPATRSRPDMSWLLRLVMQLEARRDVRPALLVRANSAALVRGGRILLAERLTHEGDGAAPPRVSIRATPATVVVLRLARTPIALPQLVARVAQSAPGVARERIENLVHELIDESVLVTDLRPPLTCLSPAEWVLERIAGIASAREIHDRLEEFVRAARAWDGLAVGNRVAAYIELARLATTLGAKADEPPLQVDTRFAVSDAHISRTIGDEVARAASLMLRLTPFPNGFPYLRAYHQAFVSRYGRYREVPLLEMLDPHWGIGPPDLGGHAAAVQFAARDQALLDLACSALRERTLAVELDAATLSRLTTYDKDPGPLPSSLDVCAFVCARPGGLEHGEFRIVVGPNVGSSAARRNLARFAGVLGEAALAALHRTKAADQRLTHAMVAEIAYLPHRFRLANVALRPPTSEREVVLGVSSGASAADHIPLDELLVGVESERFYLRWPGHTDRLVVSSSHMLNFNQAHPICRFLAHVNADQQAQLHMFDWGPASSFAFLPRVQSGRVVLRPAQWRIGCAAAADRATPGAFAVFLDRQRSELQIPRHVYLSNGDVRLLLDLDDAAHLKQLLHAAQRAGPGGTLLLQEALPGPQDAWLAGPGGHYIVELVVSVARSAQEREPSPSRVTAAQPASPRMIGPGGSWLYLKIYTSPDNEEDLLLGPLTAFLEEARASTLLRDWYFLRYADPDSHLRVRFRTPQAEDADTLFAELNLMCRSLMERDLCNRFAFDTYEREIERYGGCEAIDAAESLFVADSDLALEMLRSFHDAKLERKTLVAVTALDLLDGLSRGGAAEAELMSGMRPHWLAAGPLYRSEKATLQSLLGDDAASLHERAGPRFLPALQRRRAVAEEVAELLSVLERRSALSNHRVDIWQSLLHMHCNRALGRDRADEQLALGLMLRAREARAARKTAR